MEPIQSFLMSLAGWPLAVLLLIGGAYFTLRTGFVQVRMVVESIRVILEKPKTPGSVSSFAALMLSTASRVGTGNIIGVSTALCLGGPGAVFWMWLTTLIGAASAFVESTLAQIYKRRHSDGSSYGGPSFYIESTMGSKWLGALFACALIFTYGVGYNMLASYNLQSSFAAFEFYRPNYCWIFGGLAALMFFITIVGGAKSLVKATSVLVPVMGIFYVLLSLVALCVNYANIPAIVRLIFSNAFDFKAIFSGFSSSVIMYGLKRGLYSNEAGIGSAPNAAAAADVSHPVKQGLVQMFSVFIDTNVLCTATAIMCLVSGLPPTAEQAGAPFVQNALRMNFGTAGPVFIAVAMVLFAFTTLLGNFYYVENCLAYLVGHPLGKTSLLIARLLGSLLIALGAGLKIDVAWGIADISQCLLAFINIPVCILIGGAAYAALKNYQEQRKTGKSPTYIAEECGVKTNTDFWHKDDE